MVALSNPSDPITLYLNQSLAQLGYITRLFNSNEDIDRIVRSSSYGKNPSNPYICFAISIDSSEGTYRYRLRYNISDSLDTEGPATDNPLFSVTPNNVHVALRTGTASGMHQMNALVINAIASKELKKEVSLIPTLSPMGWSEYVQD